MNEQLDVALIHGLDRAAEQEASGQNEAPLPDREDAAPDEES